jgi:hypothetical protein
MVLDVNATVPFLRAANCAAAVWAVVEVGECSGGAAAVMPMR